MRSLPTTRQLQYFLALSKTLNFREAAENCNITQPTLSAAIQEMEALLGTKLLDRSQRKKVVLTAFGESLVQDVQQIILDTENVLERAKEISAPLSGILRIGFIPTIAPYLLPKILPALQKKFKNIEFQINEAMSEKLVEQLNQGQIDLAIMAFPYDTGVLKHKILFEEPFYCAAPKEYFREDQNLSLEDLKNQKLLLLEDGHCLRDHALSACKLQHKDDKNTFSATSLMTLVQMTAQGYGITLLPEMFVKQGLTPKNVSLHSFKNPIPKREIGATWRHKDPQTKTISLILSELDKIV